MLIYNPDISGWGGYLRCQGQTITKPAIGGPGPSHGLALPPELLSTIHLSIINHSDPLREGWKIEKKCFRISNIVYPWKSYWKAHAWFKAQLKQVKYKRRCIQSCTVRICILSWLWGCALFKRHLEMIPCRFHWKMKIKTYTRVHKLSAHRCVINLTGSIS